MSLKIHGIIAGCLVLGAIAPCEVEGAAPAGRFSVIVSAGTVLDNKTQLVWQRTVPNLTKSTWAAAKSACGSLGLAGGGWRMPTVRELRGLVDRQQKAPALDPTAFPAAPAQQFWSGSAVTDSKGVYWVVDFAAGDSYGVAATGANALVRCVK